MAAMDTNPVTRMLAAVEAGTGVPTDLYAPTAVLDATVPMWRFEKHGPAEIAAQLSRWFDTPGTLTEVMRAPLPGGELVSFTLEWLTDGRPWVAHQVHVVTTEGARITRQEAWCGGRWDAALQARIESDLELAREA